MYFNQVPLVVTNGALIKVYTPPDFLPFSLNEKQIYYKLLVLFGLKDKKSGGLYTLIKAPLVTTNDT